MSPHSDSLSPSRRGLENLNRGRVIDMNSAIDGISTYDPKRNPNGLIISTAGAENQLMSDCLKESVKEFAKTYELQDALEYGSVSGTEDLSKAISKYINRNFKPSSSIKPSDILTTNGVTSLLDMVAFNLCDQGEGILVPTPTYSMYEHDLMARSGLNVIPVSSVPPDEQFSVEGTEKMIEAFSKAYTDATKRNIIVKAVLICNPCNPIGRFYSRKTLIAIAKFCGQHELHLVADEIFAMSGFKPPSNEERQLELFTSVLSIPEDRENGVCTENIHCLYGASKDFGMGGLRLGFLITRNKLLWQTCRRVALFTWLTPFSTSFFTYFISDDKLIDNYLSTFQKRLKQAYMKTTAAMREQEIPYLPANGGFFVWIDLSNWLQYFDGNDVRNQDASEREISREEKLTRYLIKKGVYLSMGELSMSIEPGRFRFVYTGAGDEAVIAVNRISIALKDLESDEKEDEKILSSTEKSGESFPAPRTSLVDSLRRLNCFSSG